MVYDEPTENMMPIGLTPQEAERSEVDFWNRQLLREFETDDTVTLSKGDIEEQGGLAKLAEQGWRVRVSFGERYVLGPFPRVGNEG